MNLKQYLIHLWAWFVTFPLPRTEDHAWVGRMGNGNSVCLLCKAEMYDLDDEVDLSKLEIENVA